MEISSERRNVLFVIKLVPFAVRLRLFFLLLDCIVAFFSHILLHSRSSHLHKRIETRVRYSCAFLSPFIPCAEGEARKTKNQKLIASDSSRQCDSGQPNKENEKRHKIKQIHKCNKNRLHHQFGKFADNFLNFNSIDSPFCLAHCTPTGCPQI